MANKRVARRKLPTRAKPVQRATKEAEPRIGRVFSMLEKQAEERFERLFVRLIWRLGLVSQQDVRGLSQRIDQLERRLRERRSTSHLKAVPRKPPAPSPPETVAPSSGNSAA
jgi:hypothetical protein